MNLWTYGAYGNDNDKSKGNEASNYNPITCLPLTWKLLRAIIADESYGFQDNEGILPQEQKGCRRNSKVLETSFTYIRC